MRGKLLCEWGKQFGIEGFVREEATFEVDAFCLIMTENIYLFIIFSCFGAISQMEFTWWSPPILLRLRIKNLRGLRLPCKSLY